MPSACRCQQGAHYSHAIFADCTEPPHALQPHMVLNSSSQGIFRYGLVQGADHISWVQQP